MTIQTTTPTAPGSDPAIAVGDLSVLVLETDAAPATPGGTYAKIHAGAINDSGDVAFSASLVGAAARNAIMHRSDNSTRTIVRSGDEAPGGGRYRAFGDLDLGDGQFLLFRAELEGGSAPEGVFLWTPEGVRAVALAGGTSPDGNTYRSFDRLTLTSGILDSGPFLTLAFVATMEDGKKSIVVEPSSKTNRAAEALATGDRLDQEVVDDFVMSRLGFSLCCIAQMRGAKKCFQEAIIVHDGLIMHGEVLREGAPVPGLGKVVRLLAPPAINFQTGFVAVECAGGRSGLTTLESRGDPQVFVKTGDPAPGIPGKRIQSFGPPVANSGTPRPGRFGVVSAVRLSGGRAALWVGVFAQKIPFAGEAIVPLVEGDTTDDERSLVVRAFTPLKLTNNGALLLRGTVEEKGAPREGLLLLDGLFGWQV